MGVDATVNPRPQRGATKVTRPKPADFKPVPEKEDLNNGRCL